MEWRSVLLAVAAGLWLTAAGGSAARADVYRWTDEDGNLHFTSDPSQVPARYRDQAAEPAEETKSTLNIIPGGAPAQPLKERRLESMPGFRRVQSPPSRPRRRRDDAAQETPKPPKPTPHKYHRDCSNAWRAGRCRSWVNPEWKRWKQEQDQKESDD